MPIRCGLSKHASSVAILGWQAALPPACQTSDDSGDALGGRGVLGQAPRAKDGQNVDIGSHEMWSGR